VFRSQEWQNAKPGLSEYLPGGHGVQSSPAPEVPGSQRHSRSTQTWNSLHAPSQGSVSTQTWSVQVWLLEQSESVQHPFSTFGSRQRLPLVPAPQQMKLLVQQMSAVPSPGQNAPCGQQFELPSSPPQQTVSQQPSTSQQC
jgi:hypothetical protein